MLTIIMRENRAIMLPKGKIVFRLYGRIRHDLRAVCEEFSAAEIARLLADIGGVEDLSAKERFALL